MKEYLREQREYNNKDLQKRVYEILTLRKKMLLDSMTKEDIEKELKYHEGDGFWELDPEGCCQEIDSDKLFPDLSFNDEPVEMILISGSDNESENPDDETQDEKCGDCFDNILSIKL